MDSGWWVMWIGRVYSGWRMVHSGWWIGCVYIMWIMRILVSGDWIVVGVWWIVDSSWWMVNNGWWMMDSGWWAVWIAVGGWCG